MKVIALAICLFVFTSLSALAGPPTKDYSPADGGGGGIISGRPLITTNHVYNTRYVTATRGSSGAAHSIGVKAKVNGMGAGSGWKPSGAIQSNGNGTYTLKYIKRVNQ